MDICLLMNQTLNNILGHSRFSIQMINCFKLSSPKCDFLKTLKNVRFKSLILQNTIRSY